MGGYLTVLVKTQRIGAPPHSKVARRVRNRGGTDRQSRERAHGVVGTDRSDRAKATVGG